MPRKKLQVFISSTFTDLQEERQAAVAAILKAGHIPAGMELFTSGDESQWDTITRWIDESDVYMLILGGRYGSTHPTTEEGYTEKEYDYALAQGKPFFAVVINEATLDERLKTRGKDVIELKHRDKLEAFRAKVLSRMSSFFADVKDIRLAIHETIPLLEQKNSHVGWISGAEFTETKPLVDELSKLGDENRKLQKEIVQLKSELSKTKSKLGDGDFSELRTVLSEINLDISSIKTSEDEPNTLSLLDITFRFKDALAAGIKTQSTNSEMMKFIIHKLCPKLLIYELVQIEKVTGVIWRRYTLTAKGKRFLANIESNMISKGSSDTSQASEDVQ